MHRLSLRSSSVHQGKDEKQRQYLNDVVFSSINKKYISHIVPPPKKWLYKAHVSMRRNLFFVAEKYICDKYYIFVSVGRIGRNWLGIKFDSTIVQLASWGRHVSQHFQRIIENMDFQLKVTVSSAASVLFDVHMVCILMREETHCDRNTRLQTQAQLKRCGINVILWIVNRHFKH